VLPEAVEQRGGHVTDRDPGGERSEQADHHQGDERVQADPDDQEEQQRDGDG
jgi:hypothetical protein